MVEGEGRKSKEEVLNTRNSKKASGIQEKKNQKKVEEALEKKKQQEEMRRMMDRWKTGPRSVVGRKEEEDTDAKDEEEVVDNNLVDVKPVETRQGTRPAFRAALQMFKNQNSDRSRTSFEVWKAEKHTKVEKKRKKDQTDMVEKQNDISAGRNKFLKNDLSSSDKEGKLKFKNNVITHYRIDRLQGDTGGAGDGVQGGGDGVRDGNKEVTVGNMTGQRARTEQQVKYIDRAAATSGRTGSGDSTHFVQ